MIEVILQDKLTTALVSGGIGFIIGVVTTLLLERKKFTFERIISLVVFSVWMSVHIYGFFFDKDVPTIFDFIGFGATGTLIGLNVSDWVAKIVRK